MKLAAILLVYLDHSFLLFNLHFFKAQRFLVLFIVGYWSWLREILLTAISNLMFKRCIERVIVYESSTDQFVEI